VLEREVDHAIRRSSCPPQGVEIINGAALHVCPGGSEGPRRRIRAREPDDLMARADEFGHEGGTDPTGRGEELRR
jgi:hypothetical protein